MSLSLVRLGKLNQVQLSRSVPDRSQTVCDCLTILCEPGFSEKGKELVIRQRKIFQRKRRRQIAKEIANRHILKRKVPRKVCKTLCKFANIGKDIEDFVEERRLGADQWRRTGVFTFDGN